MDSLSAPPQSTWLALSTTPDSKLYGANMGPTWVLSAPDGPHGGPTNLAIWDLMVEASIALCDNEICNISLKEDNTTSMDNGNTETPRSTNLNNYGDIEAEKVI